MILHFGLACDKNYLQPFIACISSILEQHPKDQLSFHVIVTDIPTDKVQEIENWIKKKNQSILFYEITDERLQHLITMSTWTKAVYYRLYLPLLVNKSVDRILYLDTDIIVIKNLAHLFQIQMHGFPIAAVYDNYVKTQPLIGINEEGQYFNSGVLLIDRDVWNKKKISEKVICYMIQFPDKIKFVDQCGLNAVVGKDWLQLDERYNLLYSYLPTSLNAKNLKSYLADKCIIHFTLQRPWNQLCKNRLRVLYFKYLKLSRIYKKPLVTDFKISNIPSLIKIRMIEFYENQVHIQKTWRLFKSIFAK